MYSYDSRSDMIISLKKKTQKHLYLKATIISGHKF